MALHNLRNYFNFKCSVCGTKLEFVESKKRYPNAYTLKTTVTVTVAPCPKCKEEAEKPVRLFIESIEAIINKEISDGLTKTLSDRLRKTIAGS